MSNVTSSISRYSDTHESKAFGITYTPKRFADFVAEKILESSHDVQNKSVLRILDPAIGDGELILSLLERIDQDKVNNVIVTGFETNNIALEVAIGRLKSRFPKVDFDLRLGDFLDYVVEYMESDQKSIFDDENVSDKFDLIIANPPYVRTQILGSKQSQVLAKRFNLSGRVDLYHAFMYGISQAINPQGTIGIIMSNRFLTTKSGSNVRRVFLERLSVRKIYDMGDTKIFDAAVLPAVVIANGLNCSTNSAPTFCSIYQTSESPDRESFDPISALEKPGIVRTNDGRYFKVLHGILHNHDNNDSIWSIKNESIDGWLKCIEANTWRTFQDIGKIRVGVKTCADSVFIRNDWNDLSDDEKPELLKPLTTHHSARRFRSSTLENPFQIIYTHEVIQGKRRAVDLEKFPTSKCYLESHRDVLESRKYVLKAGRKWYEIWVPQDPDAWNHPKLVFRDISEEPTFWMDLEGTIVNGDCYWLTCQTASDVDILWLAAAVANSTFAVKFYDHCFNNKLYANRRRFITQYVEKFPLPDPKRDISKLMIQHAKSLYHCDSDIECKELEVALDHLVWESFGLDFEEVGG